MTGEVLRLLTVVETVAQSHNQRTIGKPGHTAAIVRTSLFGGLSPEYLDNIRQRGSLQPTRATQR